MVIGYTREAEYVCSTLEAIGREVMLLTSPNEAELAEALQQPTSGVAVLTGQDDDALRYTLLIAARSESTRLVVSVMDERIAAQLRERVPTCAVVRSALSPSSAASN